MNIKCRNFSTIEVAHRAIPGNLQPAAHFMMGVLQTIRSGLSHKLGKEVGLRITSGYRPPGINSKTAGAASNSNHTWFINDQGEIRRVAVDCVPVGCSLEQLFDYAKTVVTGEVYINEDRGIVHIAPQFFHEPPFRRRNGKDIPDN